MDTNLFDLLGSRVIPSDEDYQRQLLKDFLPFNQNVKFEWDSEKESFYFYLNGYKIYGTSWYIGSKHDTYKTPYERLFPDVGRLEEEVCYYKYRAFLMGNPLRSSVKTLFGNLVAYDPDFAEMVLTLYDPLPLEDRLNALLAFFIFAHHAPPTPTLSQLLSKDDYTRFMNTLRYFKMGIQYRIKTAMERNNLSLSDIIPPYITPYLKPTELPILDLSDSQIKEYETVQHLSKPTAPESRPYTPSPHIIAEYVEPFYNILKLYFDPQEHDSLKTLLETGQDAPQPLVFKGEGNKLADAFRQMIKSNLITGCLKKELEDWVERNFVYIHKGKVKQYTDKYLNTIISTPEDKCKDPILKLIFENGKYKILKR